MILEQFANFPLIQWRPEQLANPQKGDYKSDR
jgi:hypothetical protein